MQPNSSAEKEAMQMLTELWRDMGTSISPELALRKSA
eukprot:gene10259-4167_t